MTEVARIPVADARRQTQQGDALLVCAYEEPDKFAAMHLAGAISLQEFRSRRDGLDRSAEIIFYCA